MRSRNISIVTIVRNAAEELESTIESVRMQSVGPVDHIIIDGLSTDRTAEVARIYRNSNPDIVQFISEADRGISDALNKGVQLASSEYIICLNAGDTFYNSTTLATIDAALKSVPRGAVLYGETQLCYPGFVSRMPHIRHEILDSVFGFFNPLCHQAMAVPRALMLAHPFREDLQFSMDLELWVSLLNLKIPFVHISEVICCYKMGGLSSNPKNVPLLLKEHLRVYSESGRSFKIIPYYGVRLRLWTEKIGGSFAELILSWYRKWR